MHLKIHQDRLEKLKKERNHALVILSGLFLICLLQSLVLLRIGDKASIHFVPLPPVISQPFSVSRNQLSDEYLADISRYFISLRFDYTPASFPEQIPLLLRYSDASFYSVLKKSLQAEEDQAKAHDISLVFMPVETFVDHRSLTVSITGDLISFMGRTRLPIKRVTYEIRYQYLYGKLSIQSLSRTKAHEQ